MLGRIKISALSGLHFYGYFIIFRVSGCFIKRIGMQFVCMYSLKARNVFTADRKTARGVGGGGGGWVGMEF